MRINKILTTLVALLWLATVVTSCRKTNDAQLKPHLSGTTHGVLMMAGNADTITITNGKAPYKITISDTTVVNATVVNDSISRLVIIAQKGGSATITVIGVDGGQINFEVTVESSYKSIILNDTLRFMQPGATTVFNKTTPNIHVYRDQGSLFGSTKNKFGWAADDGQNFLFLEFAGSPNETGIKTDATVYARVNGSVPQRITCAKVEVVQIKAGIIWIVYQQTQGSALGVMVQKQWVDGL